MMHNSAFQLRCDRCGAFMRPEPGASWVRVPEIEDGYPGDERDRCRRCTERCGPAEPSRSGLRLEMVCGVYGDPPMNNPEKDPANA